MARPLQEYQRKRNFDATPEPAGQSRRGPKAQALQCCIQQHDASHLHYDFRLQLDGTLKSWAIPKGASLAPKIRRLALPWKAMLEATQLTLALLDELGLQAFLKTSGGKGMQVVVPLTRRVEWDEVKAFSHAIVNHMAGLFPERLSALSGPKNRVGRLFIDYLRNARGATTVCAYSLRAREGLPVSVPIRREELTELKSANQWPLHNLGARLAEPEDPWASYDKTRQSITAALRKRIGLT